MSKLQARKSRSHAFKSCTHSPHFLLLDCIIGNVWNDWKPWSKQWKWTKSTWGEAYSVKILMALTVYFFTKGIRFLQGRNVNYTQPVIPQLPQTKTIVILSWFCLSHSDLQPFPKTLCLIYITVKIKPFNYFFYLSPSLIHTHTHLTFPKVIQMRKQ